MHEEIPSPEEKAKMDKEFKIWSIIVCIVMVIAVLAYIIPYFIVK